MKMKPYTHLSGLIALIIATSFSLTNAILVQPYNYMLDDSALVGQADSGSLSPFYNDQSGSSETSADKDIVSIISDRLARFKYARMLDNQQDEAPAQHHGLFSQEMADLIQNEHHSSKQQDASQQEHSLSSSVANLLMNVAQAAAQASASNDDASQSSDSSQSGNGDVAMTSRGSIMELDTTSSGNSASAPSKADLKSGTSQWFNPKETIPVLKISSMATPSKYKKVYFRSEKKLVDGAFHSLPSSEQDEKKSLMKPFNSGVQRRSSRGTSSSAAPPSVLQDGVIDFLKKFRDVYIQTRPVGTASASSASNLASSVVSAAASSPFASVLAIPSSSSGSRPNLASALSAASSMVNSAAMVAQAASPSSASSGSATATAAGAGSSSSPVRAPLTAQSYVSFWSKTFPTWVRKMLKQLRRRSLYNSSKRRQHHQHSATSAIGQAAQAAGSVASAVEQATSAAGGSSSSSSTSH